MLVSVDAAMFDSGLSFFSSSSQSKSTKSTSPSSSLSMPSLHTCSSGCSCNCGFWFSNIGDGIFCRLFDSDCKSNIDNMLPSTDGISNCCCCSVCSSSVCSFPISDWISISD